MRLEHANITVSNIDTSFQFYSEVFGFESGAALRLLHDLDLIACYRMLGHDGLADDRDSELSAPLLGVALRF